MKKPLRKHPILRLLLNRLTVTVVLSAFFLIGFGLIRPRTQTGLPAVVQELKKLEWDGVADLVIVGDSRSAAGLSPKRMNEELRDARILNFAFSDNGYQPEYLEHIPRVLDPKSPKKTVVIGISPFALSPPLQERGYRAAARTPWFRFRWKYFGDLLNFFDPIDKWSFVNFVRGKTERGFFRHYHEDGWLESTLVPPRPEDSAAKMRTQYAGTKIDPAVTDGLIAAVKKWSDAGIRVFGFRTPTALDVYTIENEITGFEKMGFDQRWREAGGIWLELPVEGWETYDGSHLTPQAAMKFSDMVAELIVKSSSTSTTTSRPPPHTDPSGAGH